MIAMTGTPPSADLARTHLDHFGPARLGLDDPLGPGTAAPGLSDTALLEHQRQATDDGDHERFAHFVPKDKIVESAVTGNPVTALCGKKWVPSRDPSRFPVCPDCKRIYESLPRGGGEGRD